MSPAEASRAERILRVFDELGRDRLDLHALLELAGGNPPAERTAVLDEITRMVEQGLLRAAPGSDFYERTETGRHAVAALNELTLYTRADCKLCEEMKAQLAPLLRETGATLREVDVDNDPDLRARYASDVPVLFLAGHEVARHRLDPAKLRRELQQARRSRPS